MAPVSSLLSPPMGTLGPFTMLPDIRISILVDLKSLQYHVESPQQVLRDLADDYGIEIPLGSISPPSPITVDLSRREQSYIPANAHSFCFVYPLEPIRGLQPKYWDQPKDPRMALLLCGGYVYLNEMKEVIRLNALVAGEGLVLEGPFSPVPPLLLKELQRSKRFHSVPAFHSVETDARMSTVFAWLTPEEAHSIAIMDADHDEKEVVHGAFAYLQEEGSCYYTLGGFYETQTLIGYCSDVEGDLDYFKRYVEFSKVLQWASNSTETEPVLELLPNCIFVFGGDLCDRGTGTIRLGRCLINLKKQHPDRVFFILGNRDCNKMRITSELARSEFDLLKDLPGPYWVSAEQQTTLMQYLSKMIEAGGETVSEAELEKHNTKSNRIKWMLKHTYGADGDFENRRAELALTMDMAVEEVPDRVVAASYEGSVAAGGWLREYLSLGQLAYLHEETQTLFLHGGFMSKLGGVFIGRVPEDGQEYPAKEWAAKLNEWCTRQMCDWHAFPEWNDDRSYRGGDLLMDYTVPKPKYSACTGSVIMGRHLTETGMPQHVPMEVVKKLNAQGVRRVVLGHTPHGDCPTIIYDGDKETDNGLHVIMADTGYSGRQLSPQGYTRHRGECHYNCRAEVRGAWGES
mmetsp:Transcript_147666/g.258178  ORF Transcript_147666/g.258178 Transcript_147666/m.258178 type:complete len:630 (-) Transcript_147666:890-2779(-)